MPWSSNPWERLRQEKEHFKDMLPIGRCWGLINLRNYLALRWAILRGRPLKRPFACQLKHQDNFGYQLLQSSQTSWKETKIAIQEWWRNHQPQK